MLKFRPIPTKIAGEMHFKETVGRQNDRITLRHED